MDVITHLIALQLNFAILDGKEETIGHILMEISRVKKYFIDRGATVTAQLTGFHYRRSPLVQGGLEIPCKITVTISETVSNLLCMEKCRHCHWPLYWNKKWRNHGLVYLSYKWCAAPSTSFPQKEEVVKKKTDNARHKARYTRLFQPGNKARTYQKEKFSWPQYNSYRLAM